MNVNLKTFLKRGWVGGVKGKSKPKGGMGHGEAWGTSKIRFKTRFKNQV